MVNGFQKARMTPTPQGECQVNPFPQKDNDMKKREGEWE
jgi:hypothetical protein